MQDKKSNNPISIKLLIVGILFIANVSNAQKQDVVFTQLANQDAIDEPVLGHKAAIFTVKSNVWKIINLPSQFEIMGWEYAAHSNRGNWIWGLARIDVAGPGPSYEIAVSNNSGTTWRFVSLVLVSRFSEFVDFSVAANGKGQITVEVSDEGNAEKLVGFYTYATPDNGLSWSKTPKYSKIKPLFQSDNTSPLKIAMPFPRFD